MSGGKGGSQSSNVDLFPGQAEDIAMYRQAAKTVAGMPYAPYAGPKVAAFNPMQEAAMMSAAKGAESYGLIAPGTAGDLVSGGMVTPDYVQEDGLAGHTGMETYMRSLAALEEIAPNYMETYRSLFPVGPDQDLPYYYPQMEYLSPELQEKFFNITDADGNPLDPESEGYGDYLGNVYASTSYGGSVDPYQYFGIDPRRYIRGGFLG